VDYCLLLVRCGTELLLIMTSFKAYAAMTKGGKLEAWSYAPRHLGDNDVEIKISHSGICHSDIHQIDSGWGESIYPIVPGHEIIGEVVAAGPKVSTIKKGDRVGVGAQIWTCAGKSCSDCSSGDDVHCSKAVFTYNSKYADGTVAYGGYAEAVRVDEQYAFKIPAELKSDAAAPLMCAGTTVYAPLDNYKDKVVGKRVGVVGVGGLGHLAIQFAAKMGAEVTAISGTTSKREDALKLGAKHFLATSNEEDVKKHERSLDFILCTASDNVDYPLMFRLMRPWAIFCTVGLPEKNVSLKANDLCGKNMAFTGSMLGTKKQIRDMLAFSAKHGISSWVENLPMHECNKGVQHVRDGKARYRVVLHN